MPVASRPIASFSALHEHELARLETMAQSGVALAVPAALHYCVQHQLSPPPWLLPATTEMLCGLLKREKSTKRGRACGPVARYRQDMIDYARWDQVMVVREKQQEILKQVQKLRSLPTIPKSILDEQEKMLAWVGHTLNRAFECASMLLEGSEAFGSAEAMKRSYFQVRRNSKDSDRTLRYHQLSRHLLLKFGVKESHEIRPRKKSVPLYELTY
jgi:hypothetical protein